MLTFFIASHHGRENGYCADVFNYCSPEIVVISDQEKRYGTQEHNLYARHVRGQGINFGSVLAPKYRKVLTTRNDGSIRIYEQSGQMRILTEPNNLIATS